MSHSCLDCRVKHLGSQIDDLKNQLYEKLNRHSFTYVEVYKLSLKLDELINEYQRRRYGKRNNR